MANMRVLNEDNTGPSIYDDMVAMGSGTTSGTRDDRVGIIYLRAENYYIIKDITGITRIDIKMIKRRLCVHISTLFYSTSTTTTVL